MVYKGQVQVAADVINSESRAFTRFRFLPVHENEESLRYVSVSPDGRYVSIAGKSGFAHLSTMTGRWRVLEILDTSAVESAFTLDSVPHVKGGMCWFGDLLILGAEVDGSHEV
jgi:hypothetical protein